VQFVRFCDNPANRAPLCSSPSSFLCCKQNEHNGDLDFSCHCDRCAHADNDDIFSFMRMTPTLSSIDEPDMETLPPLSRPRTYGELDGFLTSIINGAYGTRRAELAAYRPDAFLTLLAAERALLALQYEPHASDEPLPPDAAASIDAIFTALNIPSVAAEDSISSRVGSWMKSRLAKIGVL